MGIREEIAFLNCTSKSLGDYSDAIDDVLSILDEHLGECVAEDEAGELIARRVGDLLKRNIKPGDRVSIYVRRAR